MNRQSTHHITVCLSCRPKGAAVRPGPDLIGRLRAALAEDDGLAGFDVSGAACMAGCTRPCTVAYHGPGKASYLFGGLTSEETGAFVEFARLYEQLRDGWCSSVDRPAGLRHATLARIPAAMAASSENADCAS
ncbi:DUF1636 family protein [Ruegeria arenilitoris]|uniref:DUF1636 family protein n=1 Tax=Ruegeria arenilitoris TaxID=1173585 RepID=UPI00147D461F|nr:DUF1636 domain-containing protein [Ruegeria arenilitoris]